jgi:hypothetical protein
MESVVIYESDVFRFVHDACRFKGFGSEQPGFAQPYSAASSRY